MEFLSYEYLKFAWWLLIGVLWIGFAITEGFDMGAAMLLPFIGKTDAERRVVINAVAPHWDGNQVWLILAAGALFAAWPIVYATTFSGMYLALLILLFTLFLRPVGFDYRSKLDNPRWRNFWDWALFIPGVVPPLLLGVAMGNLFLGMPFHFDDFLRSYYEGGFFGLLHPFALVAGLLGVAMFMMQGASYLMIRTEGVVHDRAKTALKFSSLAVIVLFAIDGLWLWMGMDGFKVVSGLDPAGPSNPTLKQVVIESGAWMQNYALYPIIWIGPILGFAGAALAWLMGAAGKASLAFLGSSLSLVGVILTAGFTLFPFVMPSSTNPNHSLTMWDATSSALTLNVMFWSAMFFVPIILAYTFWCYRVMWGKVTVEFVEENKHSVY
ncbi:MAG: Cytochrome d ubiquinol oxidase subunit II (EC [uncultured Thiotrichaceae bacterium]|uniref:Cytochrome d ubiquinol oxidase subunit II (EC) n=1 Tax=uncultured Thiotrichaceae bacterium TaxID=298394 RepID=A0A6S6TRI9_9GAMM|nr:MAG: Cytochrome d ubiquinol oxidase subunit II (EC [uncultured Thiotrichaceae bacterium]